MKKRTREKIALAVFAALIVCAGFVLTSYFSTGRSWNVVASILDDTVGRMEGYTAIAYAGTASAAPPRVLSDPGSMSGELSDSSDATSSEPGAADSIGLLIQSVLAENSLIADIRVYVSDVRALYERKGADVVTLNLDNLKGYHDPVVFKTENKNVGVFSVSMYTTQARLKSIAKNLKDQGADVIICLTPKLLYLATLEYCNVVIVTDGMEEGISSTGYHEDGAFVVASPLKGTAGLVVLTGNNVASAKVIDAL